MHWEMLAEPDTAINMYYFEWPQYNLVLTMPQFEVDEYSHSQDKANHVVSLAY